MKELDMATKSASPSNLSDQTPQNPAAEIAQPTNQVQQDERVELNKQTTTPSVFVNSEPIREEQVQNAMKFLSHPKVRGSPIIHRRSFLEKKGLTKEEIDEAFRRVPDPPSSAQTAVANQDGQVKPQSSIQPQASTQTLQPAAAAPTGVISSVKSRFHWSHAVIAVGLLAVSGAGTALVFKKSIVPRLKSWIRKVVLDEDGDLVKKIDSKPSLAEEAAAAAKAAASAAADVAKASQDMLYSKTEERRKFEEFVNLLDTQVQEMKSLTNAIHRLEGQTNVSGRAAVVDQDDRVTVTGSKQPYMNGKVDYDLRSVRSSSPAPSVEPSTAPHPKSYMDIMAMIQRGEKPSNIREINDQPPNPNQQPSNPRLAPRTKPWEGTQNNPIPPYLQSQGSGDSFESMKQDNGVTDQFNSNNSVPWWQRKNARITEIDNENDNMWSESYTERPSEPPVQQRTWVPPQPPPVAMPEAAEAIRRPKPSGPQLPSDQPATHPDVTDELQRVIKFSEIGGAVETNEGSAGINPSNEIQEVRNDI